MHLCTLDDKRAKSVKAQLDAVVRGLKKDMSIWCNNHAIGWKFMVTISKLHTKCLTIKKNLLNNLSPKKLKQEKTKLARLHRDIEPQLMEFKRLVNELYDANERTRKSLKRLRQYAKEYAEYIFYKNWTLMEILNFTETIMRLYDAEYEIKEMVADELINLQSSEELNNFRIAWSIPRHALTQEFYDMFGVFYYETSKSM